MRVRREFLVTAVLFFLLPAGGDGDIVYILNNGRINLKKDIRIVSVAPSVTEILYEIGLGENIVGVTRYDDVPEDVRNKEVVGGYLDIDVEKILRIKPDVVMCEPNSGIRDSVDILSRNGIPVIVVDIRSVMNILDAVERIGELLDRKMESIELLNRLTSDYLSLQKYCRFRPNFSGLIVLNENPLMVAGSSSFVGELLNLIGIRNAYDGFQKYPVLDSEQLYVMKPDVIFNISESIMSGSTDDSKRVLSGSGIRSLSKNSVIYNLADSSFIRPSPRFIEALRMICSLTTGYFCL